MNEKIIEEENLINQSNLTQDSSSQEFQEDIDDLPEVPKKSCCSCWCCCSTIEKSKNYFRKGWRKFLINEGEDSADKPFQMLTKLFINEENAIEGLKNLRLNPNLVSENKLRNDLEFYIPQLCTFLLFGEMKTIEEFFVFLCRVCNTSFFFAHRVHWFLSAMINFAQDKKDEVINVLKMVNTLFKSENKKVKNRLDKFYITNSKNYLDYVKDNNLYFLYDNIDDKKNIFDTVDFNSLTMPQQEIFNKYKATREAIIEFSHIEYVREKNNILNKLKHKGKTKYSDIIHKNEDEENEVIESHSLKVGQKFKPDEVFIDISNFKLNSPDITQQEEDELFDIQENEDEHSRHSSKQDLLYDENNSEDFLSNLDNINTTGTSGKDINFISYHSTLNFIEHLCDISTELPKHPIEEQHLFLLKKINEINKKLPCNVYLPFLKDSTRNYLICHIPIEGIKIFRTKTRCPIMLTFEMIRIDEINKEIKQNNIDIVNNRKTFCPQEINLFKTKNDVSKLLIDTITEENQDYNDADYDLSKPLMIGNNNPETKDDDNNKEKRNKKQKNNKDTDQLEDKKFLKIVNKFTSQNKLILSESRRINTIYLRDRPNLDDLDTSNSSIRPIKSKINKKKEVVEKISINEEINNISEDNERESSVEISNVGKSLDYQDFSNIFGQSYYEKEKSLKSKSLFGGFKTYKIFSCIFKTHEDLRQEQFATQLINEFNQIFRLEKVDCWLNTYEIISTGNDSGLVEMVNDSLSLDQLKQKLNNIPLHDFYLYYWGKGHIDSPEYKKAMSNYVESLAGYSLICYFLQIKDRHNGNILIDKDGHLTHIDFGFLLSNAPGKGLKFENAPFKLSRDMVQNLGGDKGQYFEQFRKLLKKGFWAVHKHRDKIIILVEMMWCGNGRNLDCFEKGQETIDLLRERLAPNNCDKKADIFKFVDSLIEQSVDNWRTKWYDIFQYYVQGIFY